MTSASTGNPGRTAWIIVGVLGFLALCLLLALVGAVGVLLFAPQAPVLAGRNAMGIPQPIPAVPQQNQGIEQPTPTGLAFIPLADPTAPGEIVGVPTPVQAQASPPAALPPITFVPTAPGEIIGVSSPAPSMPTSPALPTQPGEIVGPSVAPSPQTATRTFPTRTPTPQVFLIAFSKDQGERPEDKYIWMMNSDGTNARMIIPGGSSPAFAPDGKTLAYYHWTDGIYTYKAGATVPKKIVSETGAKYLSWSHDGRWLAYASRNGASIEVVDPDGKNKRTIVPNATTPSWAPDDTWLAVSTCRGSTCGIFRVSSDGGGEVIPVVGETATNPAVSPDGRKILYQAKVMDIEQLWVINADGSEKKQLTSGAALHVDGQWAPDGSYIFYRSTEDNNWSIWRMNPDGSNRVKLPIDNVPPVDWAFEKLAITRQ